MHDNRVLNPPRSCKGMAVEMSGFAAKKGGTTIEVFRPINTLTLKTLDKKSLTLTQT